MTSGHLTSFAALFGPGPTGAPAVTGIEIPLIQRDYAQGRRDERATGVRDRFLGVLHDALTDGPPVGLDFVYGDVEDGTLRPLDGQQRLTTLFLLHWYLGSRAGALAEPQPWMNFSYATRPSARLFCRRLTQAPLPANVRDPAAWIVDQPWYLYVWKRDPTIQAMIVMISAIHDRFATGSARAAWERLTSPEDPAISFRLLPIDEMGAGDDLYIKMNSRGRPLTDFENFKARFESAIAWAGERAEAFGHRVDGTWADVLWRFRGTDDIVDDEFLRYLNFVTDVCEWRLGRRPGSSSFEDRALILFGAGDDAAAASLTFLFHAFDTWAGADVNAEMASLFTLGPASADGRLLLFGSTGAINLFDSCCRSYESGNRGRFTYGRSLLLLAVLLDRRDPSPDFPRRLRVVRNLIEASISELRTDRLPSLAADVERIIVDGSLDGLRAFNRAQIEDEQLKRAFLEEHPELAEALFRLEDHSLLRGSLHAFTLDAATFEQHAAAFASLMKGTGQWLGLTGALLASGDYGRHLNNRDLQLGSASNTEPWRYLLTGTTRAGLRNTAQALAAVLDAVSAGTSTTQVRETFLNERAAARRFDWRYYLVRYDTMREGPSGIYASVNGAMGYRIRMLNKTRMNGNYRDPYLTAVIHVADAVASIETEFFIGGYVEDPRWVHLRRSRTALRTTVTGFELAPPAGEEFREAFHRVCTQFGLPADLTLSIPQEPHDDGTVDTQDRVKAGAALLRALCAAGL